MKHIGRLVFALGATALCLNAGCDDVDWPEPESISSVRVLGVRAEPPTLSPGAQSRLSIYCVDGRRGAAADPSCKVEVAWFAQCNNPERNEPETCIRQYSKWAEQMSSSVAEIPPDAYPNWFGFGHSFDFKAPEGILVGHSEVGGKEVQYGTSYVFFAVCAGKLVLEQASNEQLPVSCRDRKTGKILGPRSFVAGVMTLYSYDSLRSANPVLLNPRFDGVTIPPYCDTNTKCPQGFDCSSEGQCLPVVAPCLEDHSDRCRAHCLTFDVGLDSFSLFEPNGVRLTTAKKSLWLDAYSNAGNLPDDDDVSFGLRAPTETTGVKRTSCVHWRAPSFATEHAQLWSVVRDNRSGFTTWDQRIIVR